MGKRKQQYGILGVKRRRTLFSFGNRETWSSSDSSDEDYAPILTTDPKPKNKTTSRQSPKNQTSSKPAVKKNHEASLSNISAAGPSSITRKTASEAQTSHHASNRGLDALPVPVLVHIFSFVVSEKGCLPFLQHARTVNSKWAEASRHPALWRQLDLAIGPVTDGMTKHKEQRWLRLLNDTNKNLLEELSVGGWRRLRPEQLLQVAESCPRLRSVCLADCLKMTGAGLHQLCQQCPTIAELDLTRAPSDLCNLIHFEPALAIIADKLTALNLSFMVLPRLLLDAVYKHASHLELLDLSNCKTLSKGPIPINTGLFQKSCSKLVVLRLANVAVNWNREYDSTLAPGFPHLRELSLARLDTGVSTYYDPTQDHIQHNQLQRLLDRSTKLQLLDLRGVMNLRYTDLLPVPSCAMRQLLLAQTQSWAGHSGLGELCAKWQESLVELDLSKIRMSTERINEVLENLFSKEHTSKLEVLNLQETRVDMQHLKLLLSSTPALRCLNLASCRELERGMKGEYTAERLAQLRTKLCR